MNNQLQIIDYKGQRVLTTSQLAESFGTDNRRISENFQRNQDRYVEGKHFIALQDEEKREFLDCTQIADGSKNAVVLYLWTEKGAWMQAKSLNTDQAWEAYEALVDDYYSVKERTAALHDLSPQLQYLISLEQKQREIETKIERTESAVSAITTGLTAVPDHTIVVSRVNEYARYTRLGHNEVYNKIYEIMKAQHGIDVKQRAENERHRINIEYFNKTGKYYAEATLKSKVNGIDIMVRMGVLDKFNSILVGLLAKAKGVPS